MFDEIDRAYFERRAREEREYAANAVNMVAARTHQQLATEYQLKLAALPQPSIEPMETRSLQKIGKRSR